LHYYLSYFFGGIFLICRKEEGWSHTLKCERINNRKDELLEKFRIGIRKIASYKTKGILTKSGIYLKTYKKAIAKVWRGNMMMK
jgi:hypothetical protein